MFIEALLLLTRGIEVVVTDGRVASFCRLLERFAEETETENIGYFRVRIRVFTQRTFSGSLRTGAEAQRSGSFLPLRCSDTILSAGANWRVSCFLSLSLCTFRSSRFGCIATVLGELAGDGTCTNPDKTAKGAQR